VKFLISDDERLLTGWSAI